ncbi:MAG TPA: protein kinase [Vicinamibacteria bacterium]|nr:protein kinase [Vicinamibacteria bacterium]
MIGRTLGRYRILEKLGQGGMGDVYLSEDAELGRKVALKVLPQSMRDDEIARQRFLREAKSAAALDHPFICHIHETGEADGIAFIAMERVEGETLEARLAAAPPEFAEALRIGIEIAEALEEAHRRGIVHRDLKPANVMLTTGGHVKVMDFGLAKQVQVGVESQADTLSRLTTEGSTLGTVPYMSPEQLAGKTVDTRCDLFSFGILLYEVLTGHHPFRKETPIHTATAIMSEKAPPLAEHLEQVPKELQRLVDRLLTVDPERRLQSAKEARHTLAAMVARLHVSGSRFRKPAVTAAMAAALLAVGAALWLPYRSQQLDERARASILEMERLANEARYVEAYELAAAARERLPDDPTLLRWLPEIADRLTITSDPEGASVYLQRLPSEEEESTERVLAGTTPLVDLQIPRTAFRVWLEKAGFVTLERVVSSELNRAEGRFGIDPSIVLDELLSVTEEVPEDMVRVPGGTYTLRGRLFRGMEPVMLEDFLIDRYETSNEKYRQFVRAGGYSEPSYWKKSFIEGGVELTFDEAMERFKDRSGLQGPREWSNEDFPEGKGDHPVTGISWYEASAYCAYLGNALPTIYQWEKAARAGRWTHFEGIVMPWGLMSLDTSSARRANFYGRETVPVTSHPFGVSPFGAYNMAGNVEEWALNERGAGRTAAGGSWADAPYVFQSGSARPPFDAARTIGFRCVRMAAPSDADQGTSRIEPRTMTDLEPVDDAIYRGFLSHYRYDKKDSPAELVESVDTPEWTREKLAFPGRDDDPILAYLYLPARARPPYQCINYVVSGTVFYGRTAAAEVEALLAPQIKEGRAVMAVVPRGAIEREWPGYPAIVPADQRATVEARDVIVHRVTEFRMGLDYLETRGDIDMDRISHMGFSWGAVQHALILIAVEPRIRSSILIGGGLFPSSWLPEVEAIHFVPRIPGPALVLTGKYDEEVPFEPYGRALHEWLPEPKQLQLVESGHLPPVEIRSPIISAFLDETLGPIARRVP